MKIRIRHILILLACFTLFLTNVKVTSLQAQEQKWLRVSRLQSYFTDYGSETEGSDGSNQINAGFSWPGDYGLVQYTLRGRALWIGCKNFTDPISGESYPYKVVGVGPRGDTEINTKIFVQSFKLKGRYEHPLVYVDDEPATDLELYDALDEVDPNLVADRVLEIKINTYMGISMTKKIMAFTNPGHDNYFIYDYVFKNTGIIDAAGTVKPQTLQDCIFYFQFRYALPGEALPGYDLGWANWAARWGKNTVNHVIGNDPLDPDFKFRAHYSWYGPHILRPVPVEDDWGCPDEKEKGVMGAAKYVGCVVLHADKSATDKNDDPYQPFTTASIGSDSLGSTPYSQFDRIAMEERYTLFMTRGKPSLSQWEVLQQSGLDIDTWVDTRDPGGYSATQGFGPYTLVPGDSIHIVLAEGVAGIDRAKNRAVGANWLAYYNKTGTPTLVMPDGSTSTDYTAYKRAWVQTGIDSIMKAFQMATDLYKASYQTPPAPPAPLFFTVNSGGDRITLTWEDNAPKEYTDFDGYEIYRSVGNVLAPETVYEKVFECSAADAVHAWDDTTARRGFDYYYYIQTKGKPSSNTIPPGVVPKSSMFLTVTNKAANLLRPAAEKLEEVRVVPNPYNIKSRILQFVDPGTDFDRDRIAFFGLPPVCTIRIYTERGDLIWQKEHTNGSGDEYWNSQTQYGQIIVSGLYIAHFQTPDGKSIFRKFLVIR